VRRYERWEWVGVLTTVCGFWKHHVGVRVSSCGRTAYHHPPHCALAAGPQVVNHNNFQEVRVRKAAAAPVAATPIAPATEELK
jgi:hypothetical protein